MQFQGSKIPAHGLISMESIMNMSVIRRRRLGIKKVLLLRNKGHRISTKKLQKDHQIVTEKKIASQFKMEKNPYKRNEDSTYLLIKDSLVRFDG